MKPSKNSTDWILPGGSPGELGYCTRCGTGLRINLPQPTEIAVACMNAFVKMHKNCELGNHFDRPATNPEEWASGRDTGISSLTIYQAITGNSSPHHLDIPYDPADFGRCYRLLKLFPAWRDQLRKVIDICPRWEPFVAAWDELTFLYEQEGDRKTKMYSRMKEIEEEARLLSR